MNEHAPRAGLGAGTGETEDPGRSDSAPVRPSPIIDLSRPDRQPTQVMDLSRTLQLHTVRLEISEATLAELRGAKAEAATQVFIPPPAAVPWLQSGDTLRIEVPRVRTLAFEVPRDLIQRPVAGELANTLYDGGALRDLAVQLATVRESESAGTPAADCVATPPKLALSGALHRPLAAFRKSSWPKQLTIALLPLAIAGTWAMRDGSASASSAPPTAPMRSPAPSAAPARTSAAPTPSPSPVSTASSSANISSERTLLEAAARPSDPSDPSERLALIAAFSGNKAEAAALYDRLAATRNSRTFALAARLTREDRVRKP